MFDDDLFIRMRKFFNDMSLFDQDFLDLSDIGDVMTDQPIIYGYKFTMGPDGIPHYSVYSNVDDISKKLENKFDKQLPASLPTKSHSEKDSINSEGFRTPQHDLIDEDDSFELIVELPGVEKKEIDVLSKETVITITTQNPTYKYKVELPLKAKILPKKVKATFKNGILELKLPKDKSNSESDTSQISVD